jgi:hypothetical protein
MVIPNTPFRATLVTRGRKTGEKHSVMLRGVMYNNKIYFSRHRPDSDWFKNAIANSKVEVLFDDSQFYGTAKQVTDDGLNEKISTLKYPGEPRANEKRIAIEITPNE